MAGERRFEDIVAWQLSARLRDEVLCATASGAVTRDVKFRDQIRDAARSAPRLLAEGFGRFQPRDFSRYCRMARGSLDETRNHILDGHKQKYFSDQQCSSLLHLAARASRATTGLLKYLLSVDPDKWRSKRESCAGDDPP